MNFEELRPKLFDVSTGGVFIVGQNPGPKRQNVEETGYVWERGEPSQLVLKAIDGFDNIVLTNVCNYREFTKETLLKGLNNLKLMYNKYKPRKIICLGNIAHRCVMKLNLDCEVVHMQHPSFIVRFDKDKNQYVNLIRKELA